MSNHRVLEHHHQTLEQLMSTVAKIGADIALIKPLPKNANDKNQVYWSADFDMLNQIFEFDFQERGLSISQTKSRSDGSKRIPEGVFKKFSWLDNNLEMIEAKNVKMLIYAQYPEMRLSGFKTVENQIPESLSVTYTKSTPEAKRLLVLARVPGKGAVALIVIADDPLLAEVSGLPGYKGSHVVKRLYVSEKGTTLLKKLLGDVVGNWLPGVKLSKLGLTEAFNSSQVCGYTLEHALDIKPNSNKGGDIFGIELKTHTRKKVSLMTPEPDMGSYADDFKAFMTDPDICYQKPDGSWRFTGVHKVDCLCPKSNLTMRIMNYDPNEPNFSKQMHKDIYVGLFKQDGSTLAAGWSLARLMNCWGAKHNEAVYISAEKRDAIRSESIDMGCANEVFFNNKVLWCKGTGPGKLLHALHKGIIILDPAPKYVPHDPGKSKRRSQWRVSDIYAALPFLYEEAKVVQLG
jgi:hypothetical protein